MWDDFDFDMEYSELDFEYDGALDPGEVFIDDGYAFDEFDSGEYYSDDEFFPLEPEFYPESGEFPNDQYYYEQEIETARVPSLPSQLPGVPQAPGPSAVPKLSLPGIADAAKAVLPFFARGGTSAAPRAASYPGMPLQYGNPMARPIGALAAGGSRGLPAINRQSLQAKPQPNLTASRNRNMLLIGGGIAAASLLFFALPSNSRKRRRK